MLDILYYSNYCAFCQKVIQHLVKLGLSEKMNFICIDKRKRDDQNNHLYVYLENGKRVIMPPNVHSVPALLLTKQNYRVLFGDESILQHLAAATAAAASSSAPQMYRTGGGGGGGGGGGAGAGGNGSIVLQSPNGEPLGVNLQLSSKGVCIVSEKFTPYDMSVDELSAKGNGGRRDMHFYYPASHDIQYNKIVTPPDTYRPDKVSQNVTIDSLEKNRYNDIPKETEPSFL